MTLTALMVRPWIIQVQKRGAIPRVLADDLHLVAAGETHYENYMKSISDSHMFITTDGGRITASKSYAYSTDKRTRKRLHNTGYDILQHAKVPVVTHCRDLGGQLSMTKRVMAPTLTKRISKARRSIRKIGGIPTATKRKARILRDKSFTEAIYAGSISPANMTQLRTTQSAIINAVCPRGFPMRSPAIAARTFSDIPTKDLDLNTAIVTNAMRIFRRMTQSNECNIARHYITQPRLVKANGPIAIIFNNVHAWGAEIDEHFWFQDVGETRVNIRHGPIQTVEHAITRASSKHAISKAEASRKRIDGAAQTDWTLTLADIYEHHKDDQTHTQSHHVSGFVAQAPLSQSQARNGQ